MLRTVKMILFLGAAAALAAAAPPKKNPDVEKTVKAQLVGKVFTTKILVGSYTPCPNSPRNDALKMVDTELALHGQIGYLARMDCFFPGGMVIDASRFYVQQPSLSGSIPPGTPVWIRGVDFKNDRVEIRLSTNNNDLAEGSGKIKYMVGADYRAWSTDELMEAIARGIQIPAYERLAQLKAEFETLNGSLPEAEGKYNAPSEDAHSKLVNALALREILEKLQRNRAELAALGKSDSQAGNYAEKLSALKPEIARLSDEVHKERVAQVRDKLKNQLTELSDIQTKVRQKAPSSLAEWQQRSDLLTRYAALLYEREKLLIVLKNENEAPTPEDNKIIDDSRAEIETVKKSLELGHRQIELADLTSQYGQLTKKRAHALDAYSRAFATPKERPTLQELIAVLGQMVTNREQAVALGDKAAEKQLILCRTEAEKYKRK